MFIFTCACVAFSSCFLAVPFFSGRPNHESASTILIQGRLRRVLPARAGTGQNRSQCWTELSHADVPTIQRNLLLPRPQPADRWGCQVMSADLGGHLKETAANSLTQELVSEARGGQGMQV